MFEFPPVSLLAFGSNDQKRSSHVMVAAADCHRSVEFRKTTGRIPGNSETQENA